MKITNLALVSLTLTTTNYAANIFTGVGANTAGLQSVVDSFRSALGNGSTTPNLPEGSNFADGFRSIDWDAAPDGVSTPNSFPGNFFNTDFFPRARGMSFSTDGSGFALSATAASSTLPNFENFNPAYASEFSTFSPERLFSPLGSNVLEVTFFDPARPNQGALVDGFGAVFVDADMASLSRIDYFGIDNNLLTSVFADPLDGGLSFVGAHFDTEGEVLAKAVIYLGNGVLGDNDTQLTDVVVLDDFIAGEPAAIPEPSSAILAGLAGLLTLSLRRRSS